MFSEKCVRLTSLHETPVVAIYERDRGQNVTVIYVLVRTDYEETAAQAIERAERIARRLTEGSSQNREMILRKSSPHTHKGDIQDGTESAGQ